MSAIIPLYDPLNVACGVAGNFISVLAILSPCFSTIRDIRRSRSSTAYSVAPYLVPLLSSPLWVFYAINLRINTFFLITINAFSILMSLCYTLIHLYYAALESRTWTLLGFVGESVVVAATVLVSYYAPFQTDSTRLVFLGATAATCGVLTAGSPLLAVRHVITHKDASTISLPLALCTILGAIVWFVYGLAIQNLFVALPNVAGLVLGTVQIGLWLLYRPSTTLAGTSAAPAATATPAVSSTAIESDMIVPVA